MDGLRWFAGAVFPGFSAITSAASDGRAADPHPPPPSSTVTHRAVASSTATAMPSTPALRAHKQLADSAYHSISAALDLEQKNGAVSEVVNLYRKGINHLRNALQMVFATEAERAIAESLNAKMMNNLVFVEDRIAELESRAASLSASSKLPSKESSGFNLKSSAPASRTGTPTSSFSLPSTTLPSSAAASASLPKHPQVGSNGRSSSSSSIGAAGSVSGGRQKLSRKGSSSAGDRSTPKTLPANAKLPPNIDSAMANRILNEVVVDGSGSPVAWDDIAGLESAKQALREIVILPTLRPELFTGLRSPARGVLLFGPPGTGKTMLAKAVAHESRATFFSISASTLTSKFVGEGEKMVRALFGVARHLQPSVIFIDEIDSILTERSEGEHEASRRLKTEFLLQFDGLGSSSEDRLLVMGATNRPQELDEAARRRLVKRIYIPLPEPETRASLILHLLNGHRNSLTSADIRRLVALTEGYSGSDISALAREAAVGPIRSLGDSLLSTPADRIRPIGLQDFVAALNIIKPSVSKSSLTTFDKWNTEFGTAGS